MAWDLGLTRIVKDPLLTTKELRRSPVMWDPLQEGLAPLLARWNWRHLVLATLNRSVS